MSKYLKGNYRISGDQTEPDAKPEETSIQEFERRALERLGGSIAFVKKDAFVWKGDKPKTNEKA